MARAGEDPKVRALREARSLNPRPEAVRDEQFAGSEFLDARDLVQVKYEMVRRVRVDGEPVSRAAAAFGFSRPSFYAAAARWTATGWPGWCRPGRGRGGRTSSPTRSSPSRASAARRTRSWARRAGRAIAERFGIRVHPRSVERALARAERPKSEGDR